MFEYNVALPLGLTGSEQMSCDVSHHGVHHLHLEPWVGSFFIVLLLAARSVCWRISQWTWRPLVELVALFMIFDI